MESDLKPLEGVRVLDFTHIVAGPHCTMLMADAGAEVIKVEPPGGDPGRYRGAVRHVEGVGEVSAYFYACNRGKVSIELDLESEDDRLKLAALLLKVDVVVENFREGTLARYGFDGDTVLRHHPSLIYTSIRAFPGSDPGRSGRGGLAIVAEGESGLASHCRDSDGTPVWYGVPAGDYITGLTAYGSIITALYERQLSGKGRHIEVSMVNALMALTSAHLAAYAIDGERGIDTARNTAPYNFFRARDGYVTIAITMDKFWGPLCKLMGRPDLIDDDRYGTARERNSRQSEVEAIVGPWVAALDRDELIARLEPLGIPCGAVNSTADVVSGGKFSDSYLMSVQDGLGGSALLPVNPMGFQPDNPRVPTPNSGMERFNQLLEDHAPLASVPADKC